MSIIKTIKKKIRGIGKRVGIMDDFEWSNYYEDEYSKQIFDLEKQHSLVLPDGKYNIIDGSIILDNGVLPLHENHKDLYELFLNLQPNSILEVGCGGGDHLTNIRKLMPTVKLKGFDLSQKQLSFLFNRHPQLKEVVDVFVQDLTSFNYKNVKADLVFTQAVLMHIERRKFYIQALKNILSSTNKIVVLVENWDRRDYIKDIKELFNSQNLPWKNLYFYTTNKKIPLIISHIPLSGFKKIENNQELLSK